MACIQSDACWFSCRPSSPKAVVTFLTPYSHPGQVQNNTDKLKGNGADKNEGRIDVGEERATAKRKYWLKLEGDKGSQKRACCLLLIWLNIKNVFIITWKTNTKVKKTLFSTLCPDSDETLQVLICLKKQMSFNTTSMILQNLCHNTSRTTSNLKTTLVVIFY